MRNIASPQEKSAPEAVVPDALASATMEGPEVSEGAVEGPAEASPPILEASPSLEEPTESGPVAVLVVHPVASTARLVRETLENFTDCKVYTTVDSLQGFEMALQRRYAVFLFAMKSGELGGPLLYELISKAYTGGRGPRLVAPGVVFIREKDDPKLPEVLNRDARVKDVVSKPIRIERLLQAVSGMLEVRDPTAGA